jgi:proteasome assembly chaperone (PAC2) family protein
MSGLIIGVAKLREMHGTCILVETSGYVVDAKSHNNILLPVRILKQAKMKPYFNNLTFYLFF